MRGNPGGAEAVVGPDRSTAAPATCLDREAPADAGGLADHPVTVAAPGYRTLPTAVPQGVGSRLVHRRHRVVRPPPAQTGRRAYAVGARRTAPVRTREAPRPDEGGGSGSGGDPAAVRARRGA
ncbi:hypothetical protein [Streptomyces sediminimaris]|uniref:hypothetical protein n=1 Tax=Streptomyces sediminimaris TaxID=3383721 RepID=UPI0039996109